MKKLAELLKVAVGYFPKFDVNDKGPADEDFLLLIAQHILDKKPKNVVECGTGLSTIVIGRCLELIHSEKELKHPSLLAMDHLHEYAERTLEWVKARKLIKYVKVSCFPLKGYPPFYEYTFDMPPIDMLVVDGPPGSVHPMSRYGAKTLFKTLAPNATIFLDDLKRTGEIMVRDIWRFETRNFGFEFEDILTNRGTCKITFKRTKKPRVIISVPNLYWIHRDMFHPLWNMGNDERYSVQYNLLTRKPVEVAYCEMAENVRKEGFDWWLNIDADNPPTKNPLDLIELDKDIIGCPTPIWRPQLFRESDEGKPFSWNVMYYNKENDIHYEWSYPYGLQKVDALGMGCVLIAGRVFDNKDMQYQPFMREYEPSGKTHRGTDVAFCHKAKKNGFEVWAHFDYICKHYKEVELTEMLTMVAKASNPPKEKEDANRSN